MSHKKDASVARQATFDTDPDRAKIKRGTLKLPVIQTDDQHKPVDTNAKGGEQKSVASKGKLKDSTEKLRVTQTVKRDKDNLSGNNASPRDHKTDSKGSKTDTTDTVSEKQKKLNALNRNHKTGGSTVKEKEEEKDKEENKKASVLKGLNSKRSKSPEKKQTPHHNQEKSEKENPKEKKLVNQKTPVKSDKEVENKSVQNKQTKDHKGATDSVSKGNKNPNKRDVIENKAVQNKDSKDHKEPADPDLKGNKNTNKANPSPRKEVPKSENTKLNKNKTSPNSDGDSKDIHIANNKVSSTSPRKNHSSNDDHKHKEQTQKNTAVNAEEHKYNKVERNKSPNKRTQSHQKTHSKDHSPEAAASEDNKTIPNNTTSSTTAFKNSQEAQVTERGRSPEKKVISSKKGDNDKTKLTSTSDKESNEKSDSVKDKNKSLSTESGSPLTNCAPVETKLSDSKRSVVKHSTDKSEKSSERNEVDLTTAFALLVTEGSNNINDTSGQKHTKSNLKTPSPETKNTANKTAEEENVQDDSLSELKESDSNRFERHETSENSKDNVRQTYVITPSPTKLENGKLAKTPSANISELVVESIEIEAKPKGQKMQGRESYEQVYAERNTLLKAEYTFRKRIKQLEDEANGFLKTIEDLSSENRLLRDRVDFLENEMKSRGDRNANEKILRLENDKDKLESRIKQLEHLASSDANSNVDSDAMQKEVRELKAQVIKLQTENQTTNEENIKLKSENYENVKKLHAKEAEVKSLATSVTDVESEKMDKIQDLKKEHSRFEKENATLQKKNKELEKRIETLEFENTSLSEALSEKKNELKELLGVMKDENKFENEIKDLKNQVLKLQKEKKDMEATHSKEFGTATKALEELKTKFDNRSREFDELKVKADEMENEYKSLKKENSAFSKIKQSQETEITGLNAEVERLKQTLKELREKSKSDTSGLKSAKDNAEELNRDLQKIVADKENQITKLVSQLDGAKKDKENETVSLHSENERLKEENERLQNLETNLDRTESEFKHVVAKLEESDLKNKQLSIQMQDKGFEISNLEQQVFELNMKLDSSARRISQLDKEKRELEEDRREWDVKKEKINDIEASNKRLTEENKRLRGQLEVGSYSDTNRHVVEAWVSDSSSKPNQHATYVQKEKKKVQIMPHPTNLRKRANISKSSPVKSPTKPGVHHKNELAKNSVRSSRSLEDLRGSPNNKSPESEPSLPELQRETRLTTHGGMASHGYSQIHRNRVRALHNKRVY